MSPPIPPISTQSMIFVSPDVSDLKLPAKHYTPRVARDTGYTLLFAHASGMHKEQWEPAIEVLLANPNVRDAWSFDWPSHGEGATINSQVLRARDKPMSTTEWAALIAAFVKAHKFPAGSTICIGHSNGTSAMVLSTTHFPGPIPYAAMILVEPVMIPYDVYLKYKAHIDGATHFLSKMLAKRREVWPSKQDASAWLSGRLPWKQWDQRMVTLFVDHALCLEEDGSVRVACDREQEASTLLDHQPHFDAQTIYNQVAGVLPVHFIFGAEQSETAKFQTQAILDTSKGQPPAASTLEINGASHLALQERPAEVAHAISKIVASMAVPCEVSPVAKL